MDSNFLRTFIAVSALWPTRHPLLPRRAQMGLSASYLAGTIIIRTLNATQAYTRFGLPGNRAKSRLLCP